MKIDAQPCRRDEGRSIVPLVPPETDSTQDQDAYSDPSTRAISVTDVENSFVESVYNKIAAVYDWTMGPTLHLGRLKAIKLLKIQPGEKVLEVGVGTGINASLYPRDCYVTGIDFSSEMLDKAAKRIAAHGIDNVRLRRMDAAALDFPDNSFDLVYAPYVISVVSDPVKVASEMRRVCRPGGRFVFLNHFMSTNALLARAERFISPLTVHAGFKADVDLPAFLAQAELEPVDIRKVNIPRMWSLVTCNKE